MYGCSTFLFFVIFFSQPPFHSFIFQTIKEHPWKISHFNVPSSLFYQERSNQQIYVSLLVYCPIFVMVKCMEKAHSGYTNHHLLLLSSGTGVFSLGNSLHVHILIRTGSRIHSSLSSSYRVKEDQRHTRKDLWVGVPTPGGGSTLEILLGVSHEVRISVGYKDCYFWHG